MSFINALNKTEQKTMFIPNNRIHKGTSINDFKNTLFNKTASF